MAVEKIINTGNTLVFLFVGVILTIVYVKFVRKNKRVEKYLNSFPGPKPIPLFGNALTFVVPNEEFVEIGMKIIEEHGKRVRIWLSNKPYFTTALATDAEKILSSTVHINKSQDYSMLHSWLGTGLLTANNPKWFHRRKLITPTFHFKILEDFIKVFNEQAKTLTQILDKEYSNGKGFDICPYIARCALDIICETAMGKKVNAQLDQDSPYVKAVYSIAKITFFRMKSPWLHPDFIWNLTKEGRQEKKDLGILHGFTEQVIAEKKLKKHQWKESSESMVEDSDATTKPKRKVAFLDALIEASNEAGNHLSDIELRNEVDTFMFEGHDTTSVSLSWITFLLSENVECQKKLRNELQDIFGDDMTRDITMTDLTRMKYLECCIKEGLRLYPSVPLLGRELKEDCILDDGKIIPKGATAVILTPMAHRNEEYFPNPLEFKPERFFPENSHGRHPYAFIPFSAGPRNCIGQKFALLEEKVVLAHLFRKFSFEALEKLEDKKALPELVLRPYEGIQLRISPLS